MALIGVLGLQGDYGAHGKHLARAGAQMRLVKKPAQLDGLDGLIIPGGESTALIRLMEGWDFWGALRAFVDQGHPVFGTCAGMILLARQVVNPPQRSLGLIDIAVERNAYGRQVDSFEATGTYQGNGAVRSLEMVFIRAPRILSLGEGVEDLARCGERCVMARQGHVLVAAFHPELTADLTVHSYFLGMAAR